MTKTQLIHFLVLLLILTFGILTFFHESGNQSIQLMIGIVTAIAYVCWGIIHHAIQGDLYRKIVVEYILIGAIAIILLFVVLSP